MVLYLNTTAHRYSIFTRYYRWVSERKSKTSATHNDDMVIWMNKILFISGSAIVFLMIKNQPEKTNSNDQQGDLAWILSCDARMNFIIHTKSTFRR